MEDIKANAGELRKDPSNMDSTHKDTRRCWFNFDILARKEASDAQAHVVDLRKVKLMDDDVFCHCRVWFLELDPSNMLKLCLVTCSHSCKGMLESQGSINELRRVWKLRVTKRRYLRYCSCGSLKGVLMLYEEVQRSNLAFGRCRITACWIKVILQLQVSKSRTWWVCHVLPTEWNLSLLAALIYIPAKKVFSIF